MNDAQKANVGQESTGVVNAVAAVLREHRTQADWWIGGGRARCSCGWVAQRHHFDGVSNDVVEWEKANHAAAAVQAALELAAETFGINPCDGEVEMNGGETFTRRWVSPWVSVVREATQ